MLASDVVPLAALVLLLAVAYRHPRGLVELAAGVAAAAATFASGALDDAAAGRELDHLLPVVGFLAAILVVAEQCRAAGVFEALGARLATRRSLLPVVFVSAVVVTAALSLDATVVLLTPVVIAASAGYVAAELTCVRLANSASLILPVANLTNLLAMSRLDLTFGAFVWRMLPAWLVVLAVEYGVLALTARGRPARIASTPTRPTRPLPRTPLVVVTVMLVGFAVASPFGVQPVWVALAAALVLVGRSLVLGQTSARRVLDSAHLPFAVFVLCLGLVVAGLGRGWFGDLVAHLVPDSSDLAGLLLVALAGTLVANVVNNLPATLLLLPLVAPLGTTALLALLIGVNVGSSMTWTGSLANLLWRRVLTVHGRPVPTARFHLTALAAAPLAIVLAVCVLAGWSSLLG